MDVMTEFLSWTTLATFAGAATAVGLLTEWLKDLGALKKLPTQWLSYILSVVILLAATAATEGFGIDWSVWGAVPINAVLVSIASNGGYAAIVRALGQPKD